MNIESLICELEQEGIKAHEIMTIKNGIVCKGVKLDCSGEVSPIVYYSESENLESFIKKCKEIAKQEKPDFRVKEILKQEFVFEHVRLCIQKKSDEAIIKKSFLNLELFLRVIISSDNEGEISSIKVNPEFVKAGAFDVEELFIAAKKNTMLKVFVDTIAARLGLPDEMMEDKPAYIVSTEDGIGGASVLTIPSIFNDFCRKNKYDICHIIPSSTEEVLILPGPHSQKELEEFVLMISQINEAEVDPILQLEPVVYEYSLADDLVRIVAQ